MAALFPLTAVTDPKFMLFKHVLCFARIMSTLCPNVCRQTARIGGAAAPVPYAYVSQGAFACITNNQPILIQLEMNVPDVCHYTPQASGYYDNNNITQRGQGGGLAGRNTFISSLCLRD